MWMRILFSCALTLLCFTSVSAEQVILNNADNELDITLLSSSDSKTVIKYQVNAFNLDPIQINNETFYHLYSNEEALMLEEGAPALPHVNRSIIIPDSDKMNVRIISSEYTDYPGIQIIPSKGNLSRTVNPDDIPYTFGPEYNTNMFYPENLAKLTEPYILRDYRGIVVELFPFQYNHITKTLRVFTNVTVEVYSDGKDDYNILTPREYADTYVPAFENLYSNRFLNYVTDEKYTPVEEFGDMLIITYGSFSSAMQPLVDWKIQKGIKTTMVDISSIGNNSTSIKNFIQSFYDSTNLAWILLVGDASQIATPTASGGSSDPSYCKLAGSDNYPDAFIGRFSAENITDVQTQVNRTLQYEMNPQGLNWYSKGIGIGSAEGAGIGHFGEADYVHMGYIRDDLLAYNFTDVDQIYDPGASAGAVSAGVNNGRSFINYCGHGSVTAWSTTGFSNANVNNLTNADMYPFIVSVACVNGDFDGTTCFGEAWLRATDGSGNPTGAIAAYMSSINQSWTPPMDAQDEITDLLVAESKFTLGGLAFNGSCKTIDINGAGGVEIYDTWHIFGDPSVLLRTENPITLTVNHDPIVLFTATSFDVDIPGVEGALCAVSYNGTMLGSAYTNTSGTTSIPFVEALPIGEQITLTVTNYNAVPYITTIQVITPSGPYVVLDDVVIDDAVGGNGNGLAELGETISLSMTLINVGPDTAYSVNATIASTDFIIALVDDSEPFGQIAPDNGTVTVINAFEFDISLDVPDNHSVTFDLTVTGTARDTWEGSFTIPIHAPELAYTSLFVNDAAGNNNGILDPGETANIMLTLTNNGSMITPNVTGTISTTDGNVILDDPYGDFGTIDSSGATAANTIDYFTVTADADCPLGYAVACDLALVSDCGYEITLPFHITVGDRVVFYYDDFSYNQGWTGLGGTAEWEMGATVSSGGDPAQDVTPTSDNAVLGNDLGGQYNSSISTTGWVYSPMIDCAGMTGVELRFYHWLGIESSTYDHAYFEVYNGTDWVTLFENGSTSSQATSWTQDFYDLSAVADGNPNFQIRFGLGSTDGSAVYSGWNIDDIELKGYGYVGTPSMEMSEAEITDSLQPGDSSVKEFVVRNIGDGTLRFWLECDDPWIEFPADMQVIAPGDSSMMDITLNTASLPCGTSSCTIAYSSNDNSAQNGTIPVSLFIYSPDVSVAETSLDETVTSNNSKVYPMTISNNGEGRLFYQVGCQMFLKDSPLASSLKDATAVKSASDTPIGQQPADGDKSSVMESFYAAQDKGYGGPDAFGYQWIDSDEPAGPTYSWIDISAVGTELTLGDDEAQGPFALGFSFPFYDSVYTECFVGSNGILTFDEGSSSRLNAALPTTTVKSMICGWWDDIDMRKGGNVYYYYDAANGRFILSFVNAPLYYSTTGSGSLSFQFVLYPDGKVTLQYGTMDAGSLTLLSGTIGIQNSASDDGLTVVYNADYIHDNMVVEFSTQSWLSANPTGGVIEPYGQAVVDLTFDATDLEDGMYSGMVLISSNDPDSPAHQVAVTMNVSNWTCLDIDGNTTVDVADLVYLVEYSFSGGPAPAILATADADGDGTINIADIVMMVEFMFASGTQPTCGL